MDKISLINSIVQTVVMVATVVVTWIIYAKKQKDTRKDTARRVLVEYEKSVDLLNSIKEIISEDATRFDVRKLFAVNFLNNNYWEEHSHILRRELNDSEFKNINLYFEKLKILFDILGMIKRLTEEEYKSHHVKNMMGNIQGGTTTEPPLVIISQPLDYTIPVLEICKEMVDLVKIFPKEKIEKVCR